MARKDWLTGQPLERQGPNPIAGFLAGLMQAQSQKQQQEDAQRREQQKMAMMQIQEGRTLLEKAAQMDPALWGDGDFVNAWKTGSVDYLAQSGWKPPVQEQTVDYEKASKQAAWQRYQEGAATEKDLALIGLAPKNDDPYEKYHEGDVVRDKRTGKIVFQVPKTYKPDSPGGGGEKPTDPGKVKYQNNFTDENGIVWRISYNADGDEVKRVKVGKAKDSGDNIEELLKPPAKQPGILDRIGSMVGSWFGNDDEEELDKFKKALQ